MARGGRVNSVTGRVIGDDKRVMRSLRHLEKKAVPTSRRRAVNKAIATAQTKAVRATAAALDIPQKFVRKRFDKNGNAKQDRTRLFKAHKGNEDAAIYLYTRGIPVHQLGATDTKTNGVLLKRYRIWNNELEHSFIAARHGTKNKQVFTRVGKGRLPLKVEKIEDWFQHAHQHFAIAVRSVGPEFAKEFERQLELRASGRR